MTNLDDKNYITAYLHIYLSRSFSTKILHAFLVSPVLAYRTLPRFTSP
jgi:hypothetical protein